MSESAISGFSCTVLLEPTVTQTLPFNLSCLGRQLACFPQRVPSDDGGRAATAHSILSKEMRCAPGKVLQTIDFLNVALLCNFQSKYETCLH